MLDPKQVFAAAQAERVMTLPGRFAQAPLQTALLEGVRQRNAALDAMFYDVGVVRAEEARAISPWLAAEGAVLIVPPSGAGDLILCASLEEYFASGGGEIRAMAVAGVGSSALGAAAFARNVADAIGAPVAAVVSGYGLADVAAEAMGGWLLFGALNRVRHMFEHWDRLIERTIVTPPPAETDAPETSINPRESRDTLTVLSLLQDERARFDLLTGHSKGNLVISEALYALAEDNFAAACALGERLRVATFSARVLMPSYCRRVIDIMGAWDLFGAMNSRSDIVSDVIVPHAMHHTNTALQWHVPVTGTLRRALQAA